MFCNTTGIFSIIFLESFFNGDNDTKILFSEYSNEDLKHVVNLLCKCLYQIEFTKTGQKLAAVKKKYSESKVFIIRISMHLSKKDFFLGASGNPYLWFFIFEITLLFRLTAFPLALKSLPIAK